MGLADKLREVVHQAKDAGSSLAAERWLAREIEEYGELKTFRLNSRDRTVRVEVLLRGEKHEIAVHIEEYELLERDGIDYVVVRHARASREWLTALLHRFLIGKPHPLPRKYSRMIRAVLQG